MGQVLTHVFANGPPLPKPALPEETRRRYVALRLRAVRQALDLRAVDVCRAIGITAQLYSNWEAGRNRPEIEHAILFCARYGVSLDWLYLGDRSSIHKDRDVADATIRLYEAAKANFSAA